MIVEQRKCDVFGTKRDVKPYRIAVAHREPLEGHLNALEWEGDLCERALVRVREAIERALRPVKSRKKEPPPDAPGQTYISAPPLPCVAEQIGWHPNAAASFQAPMPR